MHFAWMIVQQKSGVLKGVGGWGGMGCIRFRSSVKQTGSGVSNLDGLVELPLKQGLGG